MESNMKFKSLLAAALVAASSVSYAGIDDGGDENLTVNGGELVLAMWDTVAKKSILFDTGVTFRQLIDAKDAVNPITVDLAAIDPTYKSFFNNDFTNVIWNAYVGSNWTNNGAFDSTKYFGWMYTAPQQNLPNALANTKSYNEIVQFVQGFGKNLSVFSESVTGDMTADSVNRSYRVTDPTSIAYLGSETFWDFNMFGNFNYSVSGAPGEFMNLILTSTDTNYDAGVAPAVLGRIKFDPTSDSLRINTPLPAAAWLLMSGIAGFAAIARRRKQTA
jgi:hypothetical protein